MAEKIFFFNVVLAQIIKAESLYSYTFPAPNITFFVHFQFFFFTVFSSFLGNLLIVKNIEKDRKLACSFYFSPNINIFKIKELGTFTRQIEIGY